MNELHFGVCVGIDRYPGLPGRDLGSARRDATAFRDWLLDPAGGALPEDNVRLLTVPDELSFATPFEARPQEREVYHALYGFNQRIAARLQADPSAWNRTRIYIYVAGHGVGPPNGQGALLMADAQPGLYEQVEPAFYSDWYLQCGAVHEVVILADCCRELSESIPVASAPPFEPCQRLANGTIVLKGYASRLGGRAWEPTSRDDRDKARGYFTNAVIEGLRTGAVDPVTGEVRASRLAQYVQRAVEDRTRGVAPYPQRGEWPSDLAVDMVLRPATGGPPVRERHVATIRFPAGFSGDVIARDAQLNVQGRWRASDGPWQLLVPDGFYEVIADPAAGAQAVAFEGDGLFKVTGADRDVQL